MNDVMHVVAKIWYRLYWGMIVLFALAAFGGCVAAQFMPGLETIKETYGLELPLMIFSGITLAYCFTLYWLIDKRLPSLAMLIAAMLFVLVMVCGLTLGSGTGDWVYIGAWLASGFLAGMFGTPMILGAVLLVGLYIFLDTTFEFTAVTTEMWALLGGSIVLTVPSYFFWRNKFADPVDRQLGQLSTQLQSNQEQSAILIQSIADGVIVVNTEGKISLINLAAAVLTGWSVAEASGIDVQLVLKLNQEDGKELPDDDNPFKYVLEKKKRVSQVMQVVSRDKSKHVVSLVISPISIGDKLGGAVAVIRDISAQRAEEQQRAEFISTASHEMRTPVAAIEGYLALALNEKVSTIDTRARGYLEKAHSSTQHLGQLFQDLLTSAKAEDGRLSNHPSVVEMGAFLEQLVEDLRFSAQKKGLGSEFVIGSNEAIDATSDVDTTTENAESKKVLKPLYYVWVDPDRLQEVITNLFDNAVKYTDAGKVSIGLTGNAEVVQLYIRDTGNGIPAEDIPHLFQKFYRVDNSATRTVGGTGLGLFIARKIVELYQGRMWVESQLGKGSTFFINLPRLDSAKAQQLTSSAAATPTPVPPTTT
jgi:PAS domain S-box-containing protein